MITLKTYFLIVYLLIGAIIRWNVLAVVVHDHSMRCGVAAVVLTAYHGIEM